MTKFFVDRKYVLEVGLLLFSFILFVLNDWIFIKSVKSFFLGIAYFLILYTHAQLNRFYIMPFLLKKQNIYKYFFFTILLILAFAIALSQISQLFLYKSCVLNNNQIKLSFNYQLGILLGSYICIAGPSLFVEFYHKQIKEADKEILSKKLKIDLLNQQLNPHFLFNTLNTIYGLSIDSPERTPETVVKVSELLRYQIESSNKEHVSLEDEILFIQSYIDIEKERIGYRCDISVNVDIRGIEKYHIAPMILFTFIENAFKHGTDSISRSSIDIDIKMNADLLEMNIRNSISKTAKKVKSTKVGVKNTKERLQLIYPEKHFLKLSGDENHFFTFLQIKF